MIVLEIALLFFFRYHYIGGLEYNLSSHVLYWN